MFDTRSQNEKTENNNLSLFFEGISKLFVITDYQSTSSTFGKDYECGGLGEILAAVIVLLPLLFIVIYPIYRFLPLKETLSKKYTF